MTSSSYAKPLSVLSFLCALFLISSVAFGQDKDWREIVPAELQLKSPKVEPDADAEVLFWEVRVDDSNPDSMVMKHYKRVKIFTERGREKFSKVDIPFTTNLRIKNITARVIKPDGTITDLAKADVFDREIARTDKVKVNAKSFAVPNIEAGSIFEYKYQEVFSYGSAEDMRMPFQHDVPIQNISYYFKPAGSVTYLRFNMPETKFVKDKGGFLRATMENVPSIKEEPYMPPEDEVRSWLLVYYSLDQYAKNAISSSDFWSRAGGAIVRRWGVKETLKPGKEIKAAAAEIAAGTTTPDDQMAKIFAFCKTKIKNISYDASMTEEQKDEIKPNKSPSDTYKKLQGRESEINELFASLADSLGLETRLAFGGDRSEMFFNPNQAHESFVGLFLQPGVFKYGTSPAFSTADRKYPIFFHYPWTENDDVQIALPKGYELENADSPMPIADSSKISYHNIKMRIDKANNVLHYDRSFVFGNNGFTLFQPQDYKPLKDLFDAFHKSDTHMMTVRQMQ